MIDAKQQISDWLAVDKDCLNDISLEDIEVSEYAQQNIESATSQMADQAGDEDWLDSPELGLIYNLSYKSYWVEDTKELVLLIWNANQAKTIVIPREGWMLRGDITIH
jgi:hypothetical protein